jgi:phage terminase large subunit-like protein
LACRRHLDDLARERDPQYPYQFDRKKANFVCSFIEQLPHVKGRWARPANGETGRLLLQPWQIFKTAALFGWVEKATGLRRFRKAYICEPRKQGKSPWAAGVGLYMFSADGEVGAEVYSLAGTEKQAWEVFRPARLMALRTHELQQYFGVEVNAKGLLIEEDFSRFEPLIGNPGDGGAPSCAIHDEHHEQVTTESYDTMMTGMAGREQPLSLVITTAGSSIEGPCHTLQQEVEKVLEGTIEDDRQFGLIFTIDLATSKDEDGTEWSYEWNGSKIPADDWKSEIALRKANPNYDISVSGAFLKASVRDALNSAHKQAIVKTKHLNIWVNARSGWMNLEKWRRCGDPSLRIEDFLQDPVCEGVDLASQIDLASRCKVFTRLDEKRQRHYYVFGRHYVPLDTAQDGEHQQYVKWLDQNRMVGIPGPEIQLTFIQDEIEKDLKRFRYARIAFDPWSALQMQQDLARLCGQKEPGGPDREPASRDVIVTIPQTTEFLSPAMKEIEAAVIAGRFHHDGDPVLSWAVSNVLVKPDAKDNIFPRKESHGRNKIDPFSALCNGIQQAMVVPGPKKSVYATRGLLTA